MSIKSLRIFCVFVFLTVAANGDPMILDVRNAASNIPAGLPNSGSAQGSMFIVYGTDVGPANFVVASVFPLETEIAGTSATITVNGTTVDGIMYYSGPTQVAVILPSSTPVGEGTVTVTYNGLTSPPFPITVVRNAFGVFTVNSNGAGDAIAFRGPDLVTPTNAANPGDIVSFWGTGLSGVGFDETMPAQQFDMTNVPLEAFVGGRPATIAFRGRNACCSSVDAAYVVMPADVVGCATPVTFKIGNIVSNTTTIAVAESGRACVPTNPALADAGDFRNWFAAGTISSGGIALQRAVSVSPPRTVNGVPIPGSTTRADAIGANFHRITVPPGGAGLGSAFDITSFGGCSVFSFSGQIPPGFSFTSLDAGDPLSVSGPPGNWNLPRQMVANTIHYSASVDQTGTTFTPGLYTFRGPGGPDVGMFSVDLNAPEPLVWTNQPSILEVDRSQGVTVNWTGGDPSGYVQIQGFSFINATPTSVVSSSFDCTARTTDGTFTVSPAVLLALPATGVQNIGGINFPAFGTLGVNSFTVKTFHATGIDYGNVSFTVANGNSVTYK